MAPALANDLMLACLLSLPKPGGSFWSPLWAASVFLSPPMTGWNSLCSAFFKWVLVSWLDS